MRRENDRLPKEFVVELLWRNITPDSVRTSTDSKIGCLHFCGIIASALRPPTDCRRLEIELFYSRVYCKLYDTGATDALVEAIRHNRGPTKLERYELDTRLLADALRGNTSAKTLTLLCSYGTVMLPRILSLLFIRALVHARTLVQNCGLVRLDLSNRIVNDANWKGPV
jgi:hypothetical protein